MELEDVNVKLIVMSENEFTSFRKLLHDNDILENRDRIAIGCVLRGQPCVIVHEDIFELETNLQYLILAHEAAYAIGDINTDEDADRWAMEGLTETTRNLLINSWPLRHGHTFSEVV